MIAELLRSRQVFSELAALDEPVFPLDRGALAVALEECPDLDIQEYLRRLNELGARVQVLAGNDRSAYNLIECLNEALFIQEGLQGDNEDYYDPRNSFLNEVLDRKKGIPISLSVIYMEVARRVGFPILGVGFPGHFLVKYADQDEEILIDPFNQGRIMSSEDCQDLLDRLYSGSVQLQPAFLHNMDKKAIVSRMLFNLKGIYYQKEDFRRALGVVERILMLYPEMLTEIRDRGVLLMQAGLFAKALADLERYLGCAHAPEDEDFIQRQIKILRDIVGATN